jgi:VIT1/CCC1 family predicted Fe2+/Mn2+ transporter
MSEIALKRGAIERKGRIREVVFGVQDGLLSTLGFVAGLNGAGANSRLVLLAGLVEMFAGAVSMAAGAYLSGKAELEVYQREIEEERRRWTVEPYLASEELLQAMVEEGLPKEKAYRIVKLLQEGEQSFLKTFQEKVLGLAALDPSAPVTSALVIGVWFALGALVPLAPYMFLAAYPALGAALVLSALGLFGIGAAKAVLAGRNRWRSGLEFLSIAAGAAGIGYLFGLLLPSHP